LREKLISNVRQQCNLPRALYRHHELALVRGADAGRSARQNLAALGNEAAELNGVLVIYRLRLVNAKLAYLSALAGVGSVVVSFSCQGVAPPVIIM
jgi:hypothetical protein